MPKFLRILLDGITMYRLMLYVLTVLWLIGIFFSFFRILPFQATDIFLTGVLLFIVCNLSNAAFARLVGAQANLESATISGLILTLIVGPLVFVRSVPVLCLIGVIAMGSKYFCTLHRKHIFNPSAFAVVVSTFFLHTGASWWIGDGRVLPFIVLGGLLILTKIKRYSMAAAFLAVYLLTVFIGHQPVAAALSTPAIWFFVFIMLVEPVTAPTTHVSQVVFGSVVALSTYVLPRLIDGYGYGLETALLVGNLLTVIISPSYTVVLSFRKKEQVAQDTWSFFFEPSGPVRFRPGQYMEWTLAHAHPDSRGIRRFFSVSSSPGEPLITVTTKIAPKGSSFKKAVLAMKDGDRISASNPRGGFVLPEDANIPLCFIAGGIGITPFRSMVAYLSEHGEHRDIVLLYVNGTDTEIAFGKLFEEAERIGVRTRYINSKKDGHLDEKNIAAYVPDYEKRIFYVSGPESMVVAVEKILASKKVRGIRTDYFPGYGA